MSRHTVGGALARTAVEMLGEIPNRQAQELRPGRRIQTPEKQDIAIMYAALFSEVVNNFEEQKAMNRAADARLAPKMEHI